MLNHDRQTVISGDATELSQLGEVAARQGVGLTVLRSRYPFHSALLGPAVSPFRAALCSYEFQPPSTPVYLGTEDKFYGAECDLALISLSVQFIQKLDFAGILHRMYESGYSRFIECGAGDVLTGIVSKALSGRAGLICRASAHPDRGRGGNGVSAILQASSGPLKFGGGPLSRGQVVDSIPELLQDVQAVLKRTSQVLEKVRLGRRVAPVAMSLQPDP